MNHLNHAPFGYKKKIRQIAPDQGDSYQKNLVEKTEFKSQHPESSGLKSVSALGSTYNIWFTESPIVYQEPCYIHKNILKYKPVHFSGAKAKALGN